MKKNSKLKIINFLNSLDRYDLIEEELEIRESIKKSNRKQNARNDVEMFLHFDSREDIW
jgi:hypothetical protein